MKTRILRSFLAASLLAFHLPAMADDTDLFMGIPPDPDKLPNVMLVIDNAANFSSSTTDPSSTCTLGGKTNTLSGTVGGIEQCALYNVVSSLPDDTVNLGIMLYNGSSGIVDINGATCTGGTGGCLAVPLTKLNTTTKPGLLQYIASWTTSNSTKGLSWVKANKEKTGAAMQETWAYLYGHTGLSGRPYSKQALGCHNFVVFIGNSYDSSGSPGDSTGDAGPANALAGTNTNAGMNVTPAATAKQKAQILSTLQTSCGTFTFPSSNHETGGYYADEWAGYLAAQGVKTYTIGVLDKNKCQASYAALLTSMADAGTGTYFPTSDASSLIDAIKKILSQVQAVNSAFAAVSLPVSVNTQGTYLNQVFIGMFRPDEGGLPRWHGNLKQYKLGYLNGTLQLLDADGQSAISAGGTGFIDECARSNWTGPPSNPTDAYWAFDKTKTQTCLTVANSAASNKPDGNIVEKGAQAYQLRGGANYASAVSYWRKVYTCGWSTFAACTQLISFTPKTAGGNVDGTAFGLSATDPTYPDLLKWSRGKNNTGSVSDPDWPTSLGNSTSTTQYNIRPTAHGDVVHSRPVAIDYGATAGGVVVFYGGNDGWLRAINGNRDKNADGSSGASIQGPGGAVPPGGELWAFMAPEFMLQQNVQRIRDDSSPISFPGAKYPAGVTPQAKPYGFDGPVTAYKDSVSGERWIYATMRRGGRAIYAFDVTSTSDPKLKWKVGCNPDLSDTTNCTTGFSNIGQTWSSPKVLKAVGYASSGVMKPMLIFGGGYDTCEDSDPNTCSGTSRGSQIYVLDADTGAVLTTLSLPGGRGVVSDVFVVPDPLNPNQAVYAYVGDLGGNIWRVNIGTDAPTNWTVTQIAALGCSPTDTYCNRKFEFMPDVVYDNGKYDILIGSGDREKPLYTYTNAYNVNNYFFMVQDDPSDNTWLSNAPNKCTNASGDPVICLASLVKVPLNGASPTPATVGNYRGWYLELNPHEQVVTSPITIWGTVNFSTHAPAVYQEGQCNATLGTARVYNISYVNAAGVYGETARSSLIEGGGLAPSPVAGMVTLDGSTTAVPFCIGCKPQSALQGGEPPPPPPLNQPKSRVYWQIEQ